MEVTLADFNQIIGTPLSLPAIEVPSTLGEINQLSVDIETVVSHNSRAFVYYRCDVPSSTSANRFTTQILPVNGVNFDMIIYKYKNGAYENNSNNYMQETTTVNLNDVDHFYVLVDVTGNIVSSQGVLGYITNSTNLMYYLFEREQAETQTFEFDTTYTDNLVAAGVPGMSSTNGAIVSTIVRKTFVHYSDFSLNKSLIFLDKQLVSHALIQDKLGDSELLRNELDEIFTETFFDNAVVYEKMTVAGLAQLALSEADVWETSGIRYEKTAENTINFYDINTGIPITNQVFDAVVVITSGQLSPNPVTSNNYTYFHSSLNLDKDAVTSFFFNSDAYVNFSSNIDLGQADYSEEMKDEIKETIIQSEILVTERILQAIISLGTTSTTTFSQAIGFSPLNQILGGD